MARMYPSSPPQGIPDSERHVWRALARLEDGWSVFHGIAWQGERGGRQGEGEGDFILLNPEVGLIFLEVKGGREFRIIEGRWLRVDGVSLAPIADPFEQARSTEHEVIRRIRDDFGLTGFRFGHAVAFPNLVDVFGLGLESNEATVITRSGLRDMPSAMSALVDHWGLKSSLSADEVSLIVGLLAPTTDFRTRLSDDLVLVRQRIEAWTQEQVQVLDGLGRNRRALIYGGAGTGKTILAMEKARRLAREGKRSVLVTFNVPLAVWIRTAMADAPEVDVFHFHGLVRHLAEKARKTQTDMAGRLRFTVPGHLDDGWYEGPDAELLVDAAAAVGYSVDAVIVDEGQDFASHHWTALEILLSDPMTGEYHVFLDRHQAVYRSDWEPPFDGFSYDLRRNCRNTKPIAELVSSVMGEAGEPAMVDGPDVQFVPIENIDGAAKALKRRVDEVVNQGGVPPEEVAILTSDRGLVDSLVGATVAGVRLVKPPSLDGIRVDTIHRFKGLEADAVFVILPDPARGDGGTLDEYQRKLVYVGLSRARSYLCLIARGTVGAALGLEASN
jgi:UvrD-like helicase C-terminal domain/Nuclease-related domain